MGYTKRQWIILLSLTTTLAILLLDNNAIPIVLPTLQTYFSLSETRVAWVMNGYYMGIVAFVMLGGRLTDIFGNKKIFLLSSIVYTFFSFWVSCASGIVFLVLFRIAQGVSMAFMVPASLSILMQTFPTNIRGRAWGISVLLSSLASWVGPILVGFTLQNFTWRGAFLIGPILSLFGFVSVYLFVPSDGKRKKISINAFETISFIFLMFSLIFTLMQSSRWELYSTQWLASLAVVIAFTLFFLYFTKGQEKSLFDWRLMKIRRFVSCLMIVFFAQFMISLPVYWIEYMQFERNFSPFEIGRIVGISTIPSFLCAPIVGILSDRFAPKFPIFLGFIALIASVFCFNQFLNYPDFMFLYLALVLFSSGHVFILTPVGTAALSYSFPDSRATATGIYSTVRFLAASAGLACFTLARSYTNSLDEMFVFIHGGLFFLSIIAALLTLVSLKSYNEAKVPT